MGKTLILILCFYALTSCNPDTKSEKKPLTTEERIKEALFKFWEQKIVSKGEKIETLRIDSIAYTTKKLSELYGKELDDKINVFYYKNLERWINKDTLTLIKIAKSRDSLRKCCTQGEYFLVKYSMTAKSDKNSYPLINEIKLDSKSLKEVFMPEF